MAATATHRATKLRNCEFDTNITKKMKTERLARFRAFAKKVSTTTTIGLLGCTAAAIGLFVASFIVPPTGEIHGSVLKAAGWLFSFAALFELREAIKEGLGFKVTHGNTSVEVRDQDGPGESVQTEDEGEDGDKD